MNHNGDIVSPVEYIQRFTSNAYFRPCNYNYFPIKHCHLVGNIFYMSLEKSFSSTKLVFLSKPISFDNINGGLL